MRLKHRIRGPISDTFSIANLLLFAFLRSTAVRQLADTPNAQVPSLSRTHSLALYPHLSTIRESVAYNLPNLGNGRKGNISNFPKIKVMGCETLSLLLYLTIIFKISSGICITFNSTTISSACGAFIPGTEFE